jgi:hypothetical protein
MTEIQTTESEPERLNRNFSELLQEVRVAVAGVQILFAFLLTLPFTARSPDLLGRHVAAFAVSVAGAALATILLVAPVSYHRMVFREGRKPELVRVASVLAQLGLVAFGVAMVGACFLVADVVFGLGWGIGFGAFIAVFVGLLWYALPMTTKRVDAVRPEPRRQQQRTGGRSPAKRPARRR